MPDGGCRDFNRRIKFEMIQITINNRKLETEENSTILEAAAQIGVYIPTMCFVKGLSPSTSCMVCMVKDISTGKFHPSCSALVQDGMQIETDSDEIKLLRKNALELLLSDHRGDCEAPCQRACPSHINIPEMNRLVAGEKFDQLKRFSELSCASCDAPCEKVCRRKSIDAAVSIRNIRNYIRGSVLLNVPEQQNPGNKKFNSSYGRIRDDEKNEFLKDSGNQGNRVEPLHPETGFTSGEAVMESKRCLHCDCRKVDNCYLRNLSSDYSAKQLTYRLEEKKTVTRIFYPGSVVYEPEKCIKCGNCIQVTEKTEDLAFTFIGRGFDVKVCLPFSDKIEHSLAKSAGECVRCCPTGALAFR